MDKKIKDKRMFYNIQDAGNVSLMGILAPIIMSFVVSILYIIIGGIVGQEPDVLLKTVPWVYFANLIVEFGFVIAFMLYNKHIGINGASAINLRQKSNVWVYIVVGILGLVLPICCSGVIGLWSMGLETIGYKLSELSVPVVSVGDLVLAIITVAIVPAICEELLFRGMVLNGLRSKGKWVAILISALVFALMHSNIEQLPYTFMLGVVLGYIAYETGSIIPSIVMHTFNNTIVLVTMYLQQNAIWDLNIAFTNIVALDAIIWLVIAIVLVLGAFWVISKLSKFKNDNTEIQEYYSNKFVLQEGVQVPMQKHMGKQWKKMFGCTMVVGICMLVLNFVTHLG